MEGWYMYTSPERNVAIIHSVAGVLSALTASVLIIHLLFLTAQPYLNRRREGLLRDPEANALKRQVSLFLLALFSSDLFQSLTGLMQIRWAGRGGIELDSAACATQGIALMAGDLGVSYWNVVMAIHTFLTVVALRTMSILAVVLIFFGCLIFVPLLTLVGPVILQDSSRGRFYGIAGLWCFIRDPYVQPRFWLHYFVMYISIGLIGIIYIAVFWRLQTRERTSRISSSQIMTDPLGDQSQRRRTHYNAIALKMLSYPISYAFLVLPISVGRLIQVTGAKPPQAFLNFGICILMLSGFVNGIIYVLTRKALSPFQYWTAPRPSLSFLRRERPVDAPVIWVQTERQRHEQDSKYSVDLGASAQPEEESTAKVGSSAHI